ncbi:glycosyltransferase family 4 protein [Geobacillus subterraneus]|uniref:glycosyltransferase family 4 protein n=1 Tax=Geobacillus subterraneus TaxID=129338 RepID=UPI0016189390
MKVLIGTSFVLRTGGVKSYIELLKKELSKKNCYAEVISDISMNFYSKLFAMLLSLGDIDKFRKKLVEIRSKYIENHLKKLQEIEQFDVIHAQDVIFANIIADLDMPFILTVHGPLSREAKMANKAGKHYYQFLKQLEERAYKLAKHIIAVDTGQKDIIVQDYGINPNKITVILNAVDVDYFNPEKVTNIQCDKEYFIVPRRLVPKNGVDIAIKAMGFLQNNDYELWIAGDGPQREYLEKIAFEENLVDRIRFLGSVDHVNLVNYLSNSKAVIIPSVPVHGVVEASSIAALEGMSMGKIVIASNIGGLAEIIEDGVNGLLFEAGNARELANKMQQVSSRYFEFEEIEQAARETVLNKYSSKKWIDKILDIYYQYL